MPVLRHILCFVLLTAVLAPPAAHTQATSPDSTITRLVANQKQIRIRLASGSVVELRRPRVEGTTLTGQVGSYGATAAYPVQDVSQIWRRGSSADLGFAIGASIGFMGGAALGIAVANMCILSCSNPSGSEEITAALGGGVIGGVAIGAIGALFAVAAPAERWKSVFKAEGPRITPLITGNQVGVRLTF